MPASSSETSGKENLAERFRRVMEVSQKSSEEPDFSKMTLEELGQSVITFGEAKKGQSYETVVKGDQSYVAWFTNKFANSPKYHHRRFLHYVQKFVEQAEAMQGTVQPKSRPAPKGPSQLMVHLPEEPTPIDVSDEEETALWDVIDGQRQQINQLESHQGQRIANLEMALNQIAGQLQELTQHLKDPAAQ